MSYIIDTREQKPYPLPKSVRRKLVVGDYTTTRHEGLKHVERKTPQDLYQTITRGHMRFRREIQRAIDHDIKLLVLVECSRKDFFEMKWSGASRCAIKGSTLQKIVGTIESRYDLEFIFVSSRATALKLIKTIFDEK